MCGLERQKSQLKMEITDDEIWELFKKGGDNSVEALAWKLDLTRKRVDQVINKRLTEIEKRVQEKANRNHQKRLEQEKKLKELAKKLNHEK